MMRLDLQSSDLRWVEQVRNLLIDVARASLADIPKLPEDVATRALPLAQKAQEMQNRSPNASIPFNWQGEHQEWMENVRQLLLELSRLALSEFPRLPDNIAQRALSLAETAQDIGDAAEELNLETDLNSSEVNYSEVVNPDTTLSQLRSQLKQVHSQVHNAADPRWQHLFAALDIVEEFYRQLS
ncbi:MAG: hypothetical protein ACFBSC_00110 [Microcoleaceae cyanobacterium]